MNILLILFTFCLSSHLSVIIVGEANLVPKVKVESVELLGNEKTRNSIILREMTFSVGDSMTFEMLEKEVERSRRNIFNTNLFVYCKANFDIVNGYAQVIIEVKERLYLLPLPILYLADRSFNEWWYNRNHDLKRVIYGVQLNHSNLTGNGDQLKLKTYGGFIPYFELSYARPYIDKRQRMGLRGGVFYSNQKSFAYRTWEDKLDFFQTEERTKERKGGYVEYNLRNRLYHAHKIYLGYTESKLFDNAVNLNENYFGSAGNQLNYFTFKYNYRFEKVNNIQFPLDGHIVGANLLNYGLGVSSHVNHLAIGFEYHVFKPLINKLYGSLSFIGQVSTPKKQLYPFVSAFGSGTKLVRGYELNVVDGQHFGLLKSNLKYELANKIFDISRLLKIKQFNSLPLGIYANTYADMGYVKNYFPEFSNSSLSNKLLFGGGVGLDFVTFYDTSFRVNYSVNQTGFGKLYFGVQRGI
jgi:outer membrane protein assembly factor BamA